MFVIPCLKAEDFKRQTLPAEREVQDRESFEKMSVEKPQDEIVPGQKIVKSEPFDLKKFYRDHFSVILGVSEQWDSNIFLDETDEEDDFVTVTNPDILMHFGNDFGYLEGEWIGKYNYYNNFDEFTNSNSFSLFSFLTPNDRVSIGARSNYDFTNESSVATFFGDRVLQLGYDIVSTQPQVKLAISDRLSITGGYQFDKIDVNSSELDNEIDREGQGVNGALEYEVSPTLFILGGYGVRESNFIEADVKDSFSSLVSAGFRKKFPSLFNIDFKATYDDKDFDHARDDSNVDLIGGITTTFSRYTTLFFNASYGLQESSRAEFTQYTSTRLTAALQHYLTSKTILSLKGSFELQSFDGKDILIDTISGDQDTILYNASIDLRQVIFSWLSVEAGYSFQERDADFEAEDLQDHIVRIGLKAYI